MGTGGSKELARRVRVARAVNKISQKELAEKAGVSLCSVNFIENCRKKKPRLETLTKIARALYIDPAELIKYVDAE